MRSVPIWVAAAAVMLALFIAAAGIYCSSMRLNQTYSLPSRVALWALATTTVGYGDAYPITTGGKMFASLIIVIAGSGRSTDQFALK